MPNRIGDAWTFDLSNVTFPTSNDWISLGSGLPPESYHGVFTGDVRWQRPAVGPINFQFEMDLDGYDATTGEPMDGGDGQPEFNSNLYIRGSYAEASPSSETTETIPIIDQAVFDLPTNCELRMRMLSNPPGYSAVLIKGRFVLSIVTPR